MQTKFTTQYVRIAASERPHTLARAAADSAAPVASSPYRGAGDGIWVQTFAQHMSICVELANELMANLYEFEQLIRRDIAGPAAELGLEIGRAWEALWLQLDDARSLAIRHGRDVSPYDHARRAARDLSSGAIVVDIGEWRSTGLNSQHRTVRFCAPDLAPAIEAMDVLSQAVPEAEFTRQPPPPDLRPGRRVPWGWILLAIFVGLAILIGVYEWNLVHNNKAFR